MKAAKTIVGIIVVALCCFIAIAYMKRRSPVLVELAIDVKDNHGSQFLNPFRDRNPELSASAFLDQLRAGNCATAIGGIETDPKRRVTICENERQFPIAGWHLEARGRDGERVLLRYRVTRASGQRRVLDPFWIWLTGQNNIWKVSGYEPWY